MIKRYRKSRHSNFMSNWIDSEGAKKEYEYAKKLGKNYNQRR